MSTEADRAVLTSIFNPLFPNSEYLNSEDIPSDVKENKNVTSEEEKSEQLELQGVKAAEIGDINKAIEYFNKAIEISPSRSSCYNNRAQAYRLQYNNEAALKDLNSAIALSKGQGPVASKSLCQRALIHQLNGQFEKAKEDLEAAAKLGSSFAKAFLVQINPYSALCNQMLSEMITKAIMGEFDH